MALGLRGMSAWRRVLFGAAIAVAVLELIDAFIIDQPIAAIVFGLLFLVGAWWLTRGRLAPVIYTGVLCLAELFLVLFAFGGIDALTSPASTSEFVRFAAFTLATAVGVVAAAGALATSKQA
jgi:hypothetical protein